MEMEALAHDVELSERTDDIKFKSSLPFSKMILAESVRKGLNQAGFVYPTIIQATAIPVGKSGLDLLVQSKAGTGKTLIFCTILLEAYQSDVREPQSLIIVPTREIAVQIDLVLNQVGRFCHGFRAICVIGGQDIADDRKKLQGAKAIVGTPGRILHLIKNEILNTSGIRLFIIDEADKMYSLSFRQDLKQIFNALPTRRQTIACSATFSNNLDTELASIMNNPLLISTESRATILVGIKQFVYDLPEEKTSIVEMCNKLDALKRIFGKIPFKQCVVFAGSQSRANSYKNYLEKEGWPCEIITGAQDQKTRLEMFKKFREFKTKILMTTDLMSRGIDLENVNLVINLDLPTDVVTYLHRIGRAGRFGSFGIAISFIASEKDRQNFTQLIASVGEGMNVLKFPKSNAAVDCDFWNFSNFSAEQKRYGCFGDIATAPLASEDNSTCITSGVENNFADNNYSSSINTKTFLVDSRDSAFNLVDLQLVDRNENNLQKLTPESRQSSSQRLPTSNTIDDASSIAADSDNLRSSQHDISQTSNRYQSILMEKVAIPTLVEFLVDQDESKKKDDLDLFDDYKQTLEQSRTEPAETTSTKDLNTPESTRVTARKLSTFKSLLIDHPKPSNVLLAGPNVSTAKKDIYSDYENFNGDDDSVSGAESLSQATCAEDIDKGTFILSVATPSPRESIEELENSKLDLSPHFTSCTRSASEAIHFPSPANIHPPLPIPDAGHARLGLPFVAEQRRSPREVAVAAQVPPFPQPRFAQSPTLSDRSSLSNHSTGSISSTERASSGFDEKASTSSSSGIETSEDSESPIHEQSAEESSESDDQSTCFETDDDDADDHDENYDYKSEDDEDRTLSDQCFNNSGTIKEDFRVSEETVEDTTRRQHPNVPCNGANNSTDSAHISAYETAFHYWTDLYWNQMTLVQDYVKFCNFVQEQQK